MLWKFKGVLLLILSKGKLLLMGFTKWKTLLSMLLAFGAYWSIWGWAFAAGFVLSIYVHEMGHVWALRRAGLAASAPMFIPFVGAFVRLKEAPRSPDGRRAHRPRRPVVGPGRGARLPGRLPADGLAHLGRAGARGSLHQLVQPDPRLAAGRRPRLRAALAPRANRPLRAGACRLRRGARALESP
jgi:hypothetical protein